MKLLWTIGGVVFLVLALVGLALPVVPQVPFVIASAFCFMKGSPKIYHAMLRNKTFGPIIRNWQRDGSISRGTKWFTTLSLVIATGLSVALKLDSTWLFLEVAVFIAILAFVWTRPEPHADHPATKDSRTGDSNTGRSR